MRFLKLIASIFLLRILCNTKLYQTGVLQSESNNLNNTTTFFKHRYPIATYLVCAAVTNNLSVFNDTVQLGNINLPVVSYVYPKSYNSFQPYTYEQGLASGVAAAFRRARTYRIAV